MEPEYNAFNKTHGERGLWARTDVPHGPGCGTDRICVPTIPWTWLQVEDLGEPQEMCQMCEHETIRYVFTLQHAAWPDKMLCGRCCAGWMLGDSAEALTVEQFIKNAAKRHKTHLKNLAKSRADYVFYERFAFDASLQDAAKKRAQPWRLTKSNNYGILEPRVQHILVFKAGRCWKFRVKRVFDDYEYWDNTLFPVLEDAQRAALQWTYPDPRPPDLSDAVLDARFTPDPRPSMTREEWEQRRERERALDPGWPVHVPHG